MLVYQKVKTEPEPAIYSWFIQKKVMFHSYVSLPEGKTEPAILRETVVLLPLYHHLKTHGHCLVASALSHHQMEVSRNRGTPSHHPF